MDARTIKSKIESLSRMTTANGCTEPEARNAAEMAGRLRAKLPPETEPTKGPRRRPRSTLPPENDALWWMFAQGLRGFGNPTFSGNTYNAEREQSVLNDLDAFLRGRRAGKVRF